MTDPLIPNPDGTWRVDEDAQFRMNAEREMTRRRYSLVLNIDPPPGDGFLGFVAIPYGVPADGKPYRYERDAPLPSVTWRKLNDPDAV
jgi:hypothetical protein